MVPSMAFCNYEEIIVAKLGKFFCNFVRFYYAINNQVLDIADRIYDKKREQISKSASKAPTHI